MVVKPVDCNSSKGVIKIENGEDLKKAVENDIKLSRTNTAIVEEFVSGREYTVDFWIDHGNARLLMVSEIMKIDGSFTINGCKTLPDLSENKIKQLNSIAGKIARAFDLDNMPMFMQVIDDGEEIFVLEFSARMGGGTKYRMIELYSGVPIMSIYVDRVCGKLPKIQDNLTTKKMLLYFIYCMDGVFEGLSGLNDVQNMGLIDEWYVYKATGTYMDKAENSGDRVAGILITGDSENEVEKKRLSALEIIKINDPTGKDIMLRF